MQSIVHTGLAEKMSGVMGKIGHDDITERVKNTSVQVIELWLQWLIMDWVFGARRIGEPEIFTELYIHS